MTADPMFMARFRAPDSAWPIRVRSPDRGEPLLAQPFRDEQQHQETHKHAALVGKFRLAGLGPEQVDDLVALASSRRCSHRPGAGWPAPAGASPGAILGLMGDHEAAPELVEDNRLHWDERVPINAASSFYDLEGFRAGAEVLDEVQRAELGSVAGLELLHLQCHIGVDTLAWARHGAHVVGVDFSAAAMQRATGLADELGLAEQATFMTADVYDAPRAVANRRFDVVYTGTGALCWLPEIHRWASTVAQLLRPGGRLYLAEFHPLSEVLDDATGSTVARDYFSHGANTEYLPGSYADPDAETVHDRATQWHHTLGDVLSAIAAAGLRLEFLHEHATLAFPRYGSLVAENSHFRYPHGAPRLPLSYSLAATAPSAG